MGHRGAANTQANQVLGSEIGAEIAPALSRPEVGDGDEIPDRSRRASNTSVENCGSPASDPLTLSLELDIDNRHAQKIMSQIEPDISLLKSWGGWTDDVNYRAVVSRDHDAIAGQEKAKLERTNILGHGSEGKLAGVAGRAVQMGGSVEDPSHVLPEMQSYREANLGQQNATGFRQGGPDSDGTPKHTQKSSLQNVQRATNTNDAEMSPPQGKKAEGSARNDPKVAKPSEANAPKSMTKGGEKKGGRSNKATR